jgi:hypothetical protein
MSDGAVLLSSIQHVLNSIGADRQPDNIQQLLEQTKLPSKRKVTNTEHAAFEFMLAGILRSYSEKRYKVAKDAADKMGLLGESDTITPGSKLTVYDGNFVCIHRRVNNSTVRLNADQFITELRKLGVSAEKIEKARALATSETKPACVYEASPKA